MSDIKKINRQFLRLLILYILVIVAIIVASVLVMVYLGVNYNIIYSILIAMFILMILITGLFKNKFDQITHMSYLVKIRSNEGSPIPINHLANLNQAQDIFRKNNYDRYQDTETYIIYYKISKDHIKQIFRNNILTVMVYIKNKNADFYLDRVDDEINKLRDELFREKKKVNRIIITQIKEISELDDKTRDQIKEILFVRTKHYIISTINVGLYRPSNIAVMLYSDTYSPSLYYKYHLEEIKKVL